MEAFEAISDLQMDIVITPEGPEKEELERTLEVCQEIVYAVMEGFMEVEKIEDEDDYRIFPDEECFHADLIEA